MIFIAFIFRFLAIVVIAIINLIASCLCDSRKGSDQIIAACPPTWLRSLPTDMASLLVL